MAKKRKAAKKTKLKRKIKKVTLAPDTVVSVVVPKGVVPSIINDPASGAIHVIPITSDKLKKPGWFERWFG